MESTRARSTHPMPGLGKQGDSGCPAPLCSASSCPQLSSLAGVPAPRLPKPPPSRVTGLGGPQGCSSVNTQFFTSPAGPAPLEDGVGVPWKGSALLSPQNQSSVLTSKVQEPGWKTGPNRPFLTSSPFLQGFPSSLLIKQLSHPSSADVPECTRTSKKQL